MDACLAAGRDVRDGVTKVHNVIMAYIVMAYVVVAYIVMAYIIMALYGYGHVPGRRA